MLIVGGSPSTSIVIQTHRSTLCLEGCYRQWNCIRLKNWRKEFIMLLNYILMFWAQFWKYWIKSRIKISFGFVNLWGRLSKTPKRSLWMPLKRINKPVVLLQLKKIILSSNFSNLKQGDHWMIKLENKYYH